LGDFDDGSLGRLQCFGHGPQWHVAIHHCQQAPLVGTQLDGTNFFGANLGKVDD
jgi:hypothetical protein